MAKSHQKYSFYTITWRPNGETASQWRRPYVDIGRSSTTQQY